MLVFKYLLSLLAFIFGAIFASFSGVVAYRFPKDISITKSSSFCPHCKKPIKLYDNIPILSWILLRGKCRYCKAKIGIFSFLMEIFGGLGFMLIYLQYGESIKMLPLFISLMVLLLLFIVIATIDHETHDIYNITLIVFAIIAIFIVSYRVIIFNDKWWIYIAGAVFGFLFFGTIKLISKIILKKDALGSGDIYLVGIGGFLMGVFPLLIAIFIATFTGSIVEIIKIKASKAEREAEIAFAPYLLLGIAVMAIYGDVFMNFYWEVMINAFI